MTKSKKTNLIKYFSILSFLLSISTPHPVRSETVPNAHTSGEQGAGSRQSSASSQEDAQIRNKILDKMNACFTPGSEASPRPQQQTTANPII